MNKTISARRCRSDAHSGPGVNPAGDAYTMRRRPRPLQLDVAQGDVGLLRCTELVTEDQLAAGIPHPHVIYLDRLGKSSGIRYAS